MKSQNGITYAQNYDVIVKWLAAALRGETLEVLGVKTGRIEEVFGFEPVEIAVKAGSVDVMVVDDTDAVYHIEEQRNLQKTDLYRFAAYHFQGAKQWPKLTDIILASGNVFAGDKVIESSSGRYAPIVIDFTQRDARKRLTEIREAINTGNFETWIELVFLPLYGKETGTARSNLVEEVLRFESELYHTEQLSAKFLAATLILSNKLIEKQFLYQIWEQIKMLDILEIAKEKGLEEGKMLGLQEGKNMGLQEGRALVLETTLELVIDTLIERFNAVPAHILETIRTFQNVDVLKVLHRQALKCQSLQDFETILQQVS